jgi:hypothetical protein
VQLLQVKLGEWTHFVPTQVLHTVSEVRGSQHVTSSGSRVAIITDVTMETKSQQQCLCQELPRENLHQSGITYLWAENTARAFTHKTLDDLALACTVGSLVAIN